MEHHHFPEPWPAAVCVPVHANTWRSRHKWALRSGDRLSTAPLGSCECVAHGDRSSMAPLSSSDVLRNGDRSLVM